MRARAPSRSHPAKTAAATALAVAKDSARTVPTGHKRSPRRSARRRDMSACLSHLRGAVGGVVGVQHRTGGQPAIGDLVTVGAGLRADGRELLLGPPPGDRGRRGRARGGGLAVPRLPQYLPGAGELALQLADLRGRLI